MVLADCSMAKCGIFVCCSILVLYRHAYSAGGLGSRIANEIGESAN